MADVIGPQPYQPSAQFTPALTANLDQPGFFSQVGSALGSAVQWVASPTGQQTVGNIYGAVNQWREMDLRAKEMSTAQKIATLANQWLNPQTPSVATPTIAAPGGAAQPGPVDQPQPAGLSPVLLIGGAVVLLLAMGKS